MQIKVESLSPVKKKLNIEVPADHVSAEIDKAFAAIRKRAAIKGFRKGKAPQSVIEKQFHDVMSQDVMKAIFNDTYFKALEEQGIQPVAYPVIEGDTVKRGESFSYSATVEVLPKVEVKDFSGFEAKKERFIPDESVVDKRIEEMRESLAQLNPVEPGQAVAAGCYATIDFKGYIDGKPFEHGDGSDFVLEIGSGRFIPGFEDQLIGMQSGEEREINVTFPADYGKDELAGKDATFTIKVKEIKRKELPPLDDELAKEFGDFETLEQLRAKLVELYEKQEAERIESELRDRLVKILIERNEIHVPDAFVDRQLDAMLENAKKRLAYQRMTLEMMGMDEEQYRSQFRATAETQVKGSLLLETLAQQEGVNVEESDVEERLVLISGGTPESLESARNYYRSNGQALENLRAQIREDKVIELIRSKATIAEVDRSELA